MTLRKVRNYVLDALAQPRDKTLASRLPRDLRHSLPVRFPEGHTSRMMANLGLQKFEVLQGCREDMSTLMSVQRIAGCACTMMSRDTM